MNSTGLSPEYWQITAQYKNNWPTLMKLRGLKIWSTWTILLEALSRSLIVITDIEAAVEELGKRKFKLNSTQTQEILETAKYIEE